MQRLLYTSLTAINIRYNPKMKWNKQVQYRTVTQTSTLTVKQTKTSYKYWKSIIPNAQGSVLHSEISSIWYYRTLEGHNLTLLLSSICWQSASDIACYPTLSEAIRTLFGAIGTLPDASGTIFGAVGTLPGAFGMLFDIKIKTIQNYSFATNTNK